MRNNDEELIKRASKALESRSKRGGFLFNQPGQGSHVEERDGRTYVELVNVRGPLATYRYYPSTDRLRFEEQA